MPLPIYNTSFAVYILDAISLSIFSFSSTLLNKEGKRSKEFTIFFSFSISIIFLFLPIKIAIINRVSNCVVNALVEATPISGPAKVKIFSSAILDMLLSNTFTIDIVFIRYFARNEERST